MTLVSADGERHSLDLQAASRYDAAHRYVCYAKEHPDRVPVPTLASVFEVVVDGNLNRVEGKMLQRWIVKRRGELKGPGKHPSRAIDVSGYCITEQLAVEMAIDRFGGIGARTSRTDLGHGRDRRRK